MLLGSYLHAPLFIAKETLILLQKP